MTPKFELAAFDDSDGETVTVKVDLDGQWKYAVILTTGASRTFQHTNAALDPRLARGIAHALEAAADVAELAQLEQESNDVTPLAGHRVQRADDDSECPATGTILDTAGALPEYVWVRWGTDPDTMPRREAVDELRSATGAPLT